MTSIQQQSSLLQSMEDLRRILVETGATQLAERLADVRQRMEAGPVNVQVAFCGLFSAGKSSLINALVEDAALATGAIPTTAEVAEICLPCERGNVILMDTPGVDSTDAAHQAVTEAALYHADLVVFVMDYQHVESEENMALARQFLDRGKPLCLVVNQVDKHVAWELPFERFRERVEQSFADYGVDYVRIFYTSTKAPEESDTVQLREWLQSLAGDSALIYESMRRTTEDIIRSHVWESTQAELDIAEDELYAVLDMVPFDVAEAEAWLAEKSEQLAQLEAVQAAAVAERRAEQDKFHEELRRMVDLAQISPYETTERGRLYVESLRPGFKVGWLGAKQKTAEEQAKRLQQFASDLQDRTEKFLVWPVQSSLRGWLDETEWAVAEWRSQVDSIQAPDVLRICQTSVNHGALASEKYPYQYVKDVVSSVKGSVLARVRSVVEAWFKEEPEVEPSSDTDAAARTRRECDALRSWLAVHRDRQQRLAELLTPIQDAFAEWTEGHDHRDITTYAE